MAARSHAWRTYFRKRRAEEGRNVAAINRERFLDSSTSDFTQDDQSILVGGSMRENVRNAEYSGEVWVWDLTLNRETQSLASQLVPVHACVLTDDARCLVTIAGTTPQEVEKDFECNKTVRGWDFLRGRELWTCQLLLNSKTITGWMPCALSSDGKQAAVAWTDLFSKSNSWKISLFTLPPTP